MARRTSSTRFAVLGFLGWKPMTGYDIKKLVDASIGNFWRESFGQLYPILRQLEAEGLVACSREVEEGRPDRKVYEITPSGQRALDEWLGDSVEPRPGRNELLLKLFFMRRRSADEGRRHVERFRARQQTLLARYGAIEQRFAGRNPRDPDLPYHRITLRYGQHVSRALLDWCDETLTTLDRLAEREEN